jgi:hypothetical protein
MIFRPRIQNPNPTSRTRARTRAVQAAQASHRSALWKTCSEKHVGRKGEYDTAIPKGAAALVGLSLILLLFGFSFLSSFLPCCTHIVTLSSCINGIFIELGPTSNI